MRKLKYENGKDIFPADLLRQIQKYASGTFVYIPSSDKKRAWGETSGYKRYLADRNYEIKAKFRAGAGIDALAAEYHLSFETIKKIVYTKKEELFMQYSTRLLPLTFMRDMENWRSGFINICFRTVIIKVFQTD